MNALGLTTPTDEVIGNQNVTFTIVGSKVSHDLNSTDPISPSIGRNVYVNNSPSGKQARKRSRERIDKLRQSRDTRHSKDLCNSS